MQDEFVYNSSVNRSRGKTPFEIVTGMKPRGVSDLRDISSEEKNFLISWSLYIRK